jgi:hypothetical protein
VLRYFATFRAAWAAAGVEVGRSEEAWTALEDWYLREGAGLISRAELARDLRRTPDAVHRRLYDLGLHSYQRWGWTLHRSSAWRRSRAIASRSTWTAASCRTSAAAR